MNFDLWVEKAPRSGDFSKVQSFEADPVDAKVFHRGEYCLGRKMTFEYKGELIEADIKHKFVNDVCVVCGVRL